MSRAAYAAFAHDVQAEEKLYANPRAHVRFWTKMMDVWGPCGDFEDLDFVDKENAAGGITFKVPDNGHWAEYFYGQSKYAVRPITIDLPGGYRTLWFTTSFGRIREGRKRWIQVEGVHALEHLNWVRIWPDWYFPPEFQPSKYATGIGGAVTVLSGLLFGNLIRLQAPLFSIPTGNLFDLGTWNLLRNAFWPIVVDPRGTGLFDTSKWAAVSCRMDKFMDVAQEVCELNNLSMRADLFIYGEDEQPFPEWAHLDRNTLIIRFVELGPHFRFTGTVVDGMIRTVLEMADDAIQWITYPILGEGWDEYLQKAAGTLSGRPFALYRTGKYATTGRVEQMTHIPMATRATGGGKSPAWVNDLVVNAANFAIGWLGMAIGIPGLQLGILTDRVKNTIMAFHSVEDLRLANEAGPWRFKETFVASEGTGLSLNTFAAMWSSLWAVRGYQSTAIEVVNGGPYFVGRDVNKGDPIAYELPDGTVEVEHLREIRYTESSSTGGRGRYVLQIGSGQAEQEPGAIALGKFRRLASTLTRVALGG